MSKTGLVKTHSQPGGQLGRTKWNRSLSRVNSIREQVNTSTAHFFGVHDPADEQQRWYQRRLRHCSRRYGLNAQCNLEETSLPLRGNQSMSSCGTAAAADVEVDAVDGPVSAASGSMSGSRPAVQLPRRESVAKMTYNWLKGSSVKRRPALRQRNANGGLPGPRSFLPSVSFDDDSVFEPSLSAGPRQGTPESETLSSKTMPSVSPAAYVNRQLSLEPQDNMGHNVVMMSTIRETEEAANADLVVEVDIQDERESGKKMVQVDQHSPSPIYPNLDYFPDSDADVGPMPSSDLETVLDDVFFDLTPGPAQANSQFYYPVPVESTEHKARPVVRYRATGEAADVPDSGQAAVSLHKAQSAPTKIGLKPAPPPALPKLSRRRLRKEFERTMQERHMAKPIWSRALSTALANSDRRRFGEGIMGRVFKRSMKRKHELHPDLVRKLDDFDDHRPFFTYWVTSVQIFICILTLCAYGIGPYGFMRRKVVASVQMSSMMYERVAYFEQENFWLGPRFADLVHVGAKFSPCMRPDRWIRERQAVAKRKESETACCVRRDGSGCMQSDERQCAAGIAIWHKWTNDTAAVTRDEYGQRRNQLPPNVGGKMRSSGTVCGLDPRFCSNPVSSSPVEWSDDITEWPKCKNSSAEGESYAHMSCEITGRPCCIGIKGECKIATREFCDFVHGYFHEEAFLCSQVSCMQDVCGMVPFVNKNHPDQYARLFTSLFVHAGLIHLAATVAVQYFLMRDLEKLIGWARLGILYFGCGIAGNMASAIFVPYQAEVGPAGSHFGLVASLVVDAIYSWHLLAKPWKALGQLAVVVVFLFILGLLPWIDNWAHFFGFLLGLLLSFALLPYLTWRRGDRTRRVIIVVLSLSLALGLFILLGVLLLMDSVNCERCVYFNCLKWSDEFCYDAGTELINELPPY